MAEFYHFHGKGPALDKSVSDIYRYIVAFGSIGRSRVIEHFSLVLKPSF